MRKGREAAGAGQRTDQAWVLMRGHGVGKPGSPNSLKPPIRPRTVVQSLGHAPRPGPPPRCPSPWVGSQPQIPIRTPAPGPHELAWPLTHTQMRAPSSLGGAAEPAGRPPPGQLTWPAAPMPRCVRLAARLPVLLELLCSAGRWASGSSGPGGGRGSGCWSGSGRGAPVLWVAGIRAVVFSWSADGRCWGKARQRGGELSGRLLACSPQKLWWGQEKAGYEKNQQVQNDTPQ